MEKILSMLFLAMMVVTAAADGNAEFKKGEFLGNVGLGVGTHRLNGVGGPTFTQKASFEYGICNFGKKMSLGIGFTIANSYGDKRNGVLAGVYDYKVSTIMYSYVKKGRVWREQSYAGATIHRKGFGTKDVRIASDDIKLFPMVSFHYQVLPSLELFASLGGGVSIINQVVSDGDFTRGFEKKTKLKKIDTSIKRTQYSLTYSYNDLDHAVFDDDEYKTKVGGAFSFYVGARYFFSKHWAILSEFGITAVSIKTDYPKSWDLFNIGATYKF